MKRPYTIRDYDTTAGVDAACNYIQSRGTATELASLGRQVLTVVLLLLSLPVAWGLIRFFASK